MNISIQKCCNYDFLCGCANRNSVTSFQNVVGKVITFNNQVLIWCCGKGNFSSPTVGNRFWDLASTEWYRNTKFTKMIPLTVLVLDWILFVFTTVCCNCYIFVTIGFSQRVKSFRAWEPKFTRDLCRLQLTESSKIYHLTDHEDVKQLMCLSNDNIASAYVLDLVS